MNLILRVAMHDFFYMFADALLKIHDPCEISELLPIISYIGEYDKINPGLRGLQYRTEKCITCISNGPCCRGCRDLGPEGCLIISLKCKLFLCDKARNSMPEYANRAFYVMRSKLAIGMGQSRASVIEEFREIKAKRLK